jgi:hypothetical protein
VEYRLGHHFHRDLAGRIEVTDDLLGMLGDLPECCISVQMLAAGDKPDFEGAVVDHLSRAVYQERR